MIQHVKYGLYPTRTGALHVTSRHVVNYLFILPEDISLRVQLLYVQYTTIGILMYGSTSILPYTAKQAVHRAGVTITFNSK
jgi:hypothetical protein